MSNANTTIEDWMLSHLKISAEDIATDLERLATSIRQRALDYDTIGRPGNLTYSAVSSQIVKSIHWGVANLSAERLLRSATDADVDRAIRAALLAAKEPS